MQTILSQTKFCHMYQYEQQQTILKQLIQL